MAFKILSRSAAGRILSVALLLAVVCLCPARAEQGETVQGKEGVDALVNRCIEAYGGAEKLRAVKGWQQIGKLVSATRGVGVMARAYTPPERLRVETRFTEDSNEVRILNGERGWRSGEAVQGPLYMAMVMQAARLSLPLILLEGKERIRDLGEAEGTDRSLRRLSLALRDDMRIEVEIDPRTARILRSRSISGPLIFETAYEDLRKVDGVLFPFVETTWAMGHETGRFEVERTALDDDVPGQVFLP